MVGKNSTKIVYFMWLVLTGRVVPGEIERCRRETRREAALELTDTFNETGTNTTYHVYIARDPLTWCQSYLACKGQSQRLLTIQRQEIQHFLETRLSGLGYTGKAWLGSRRKDYGKGWTWVNESLTDYWPDDNDDLTAHNSFSTVFVEPASVTTISNADVASSQYVRCTGSNTTNEIGTTWYDAQSKCSNRGGRLRTMDEYVSDSDSRTYWLGLFYKPWIWIGDSEPEDRPVVYFKSNLASARDDDKACLNLNLTNMSWHAETCEQTTALVICQGDGNSTNNSRSHDGDGSQGMHVGLKVGLALCVICVSVAALLVLLQKKGYLKISDGILPGSIARQYHNPSRPAPPPNNEPDSSYSNVVCGSGPPMTPRLNAARPSLPSSAPSTSRSRVTYHKSRSMPRSRPLQQISQPANSVTYSLERNTVAEYSLENASGAQSMEGACSNTPVESDDCVMMFDNTMYDDSGLWGTSEAALRSMEERAPKMKPKIAKKPRKKKGYSPDGDISAPVSGNREERSNGTEHYVGPEGDLYAAVHKSKPE